MKRVKTGSLNTQRITNKASQSTSAACHFMCGANKSPSRSSGCWQALGLSKKYMDIDQKFMRAHGLLSKQSYREAFHLFQELSRDNYKGADHFLAWMYERGLGTEKDVLKAFEYYMFSAKAGDGASLLMGHIWTLPCRQGNSYPNHFLILNIKWFCLFLINRF